MLAVDENQENITNLSQWVKNPKGDKPFKIPVPYVTAYRYEKKGEHQATEIKLTKNHGRRLQKVIYTTFYSERDNFTYCNDNLEGDLVRSYRTYINDIPRQDFIVRCTAPHFEDYAVNKYLLKGSSVLNRNVYQYNWFHCDDFIGGVKNEDIYDGDNYLVGLPIEKGLVWKVEASVRPLASDLNNYIWVVTQKEMTCHGVDVLVD